MQARDYHRLTDHELVSLANGGDGSAFAALYERHRGWIVAVAHRLSGDRDAAQDALQEVMRYWLGKFARPDVPFTLTTEVRSFLYPVVRSVVVGAARRAQRQRQRGADAVALEALAARPAAPELRETEALANAVAGLPEGQREVLHLHFGDGLSLASVATALDIPIGTVKSRLAMALKSLRDVPSLLGEPAPPARP